MNLGRFRSASTYFWLTPALLATGFVIVYPLAQVVGFSFTNRGGGNSADFVGFDNYVSLFHDPLFWKAFRNNLVLMLSIPISIAVALVLTAILYLRIRATRLYEALLFLPFLPSVASIGVIFVYILGFYGPLNAVLRDVGLGVLAQPWLAEPKLAIWSILGVIVWKRIGFLILLFMARMLALDRELFDAARVDGARWAATFRHIALPQLRSVIRFAAVLGFIEVFSWTFAYVFILTRGGPFQSTYTLEYLLYQFQFQYQLVGLASAVAVILLSGAVAVALYSLHLARREGTLRTG